MKQPAPRPPRDGLPDDVQPKQRRAVHLGIAGGNVLRLELQPSFLQTVLQTVFGYAWFEWLFPEWTLPSRLILKKQKNN